MVGSKRIVTSVLKQKKRRRKSQLTVDDCHVRPAKKLRNKISTGDFTEGLPWLLGRDLTVNVFREKYFEQKHLHIRRRDSTYYNVFQDISTPESLFSMIDSGDVSVCRLNMFRCIDGSTKEVPNPPPKSPNDVRRLFKEGWSIQWLQPQHEHDALARLVAVLESQFGSLTGVNAYLTPPGVQGLAPHWDDVEVFVLQIGGKKSWRLHHSTTASPLPPDAQTLPRFSSGDLPLDSLSPCFLKPDLEPGDLLYFPRGVIHHAPNQDPKTASVHLTVSTFQKQSLYDLTLKTFEEGMAEMWETDQSLRQGIPWNALSVSSPTYPKLCSSVAEVLRRLADAVDAEVNAASACGSGNSVDGAVAGALGELGVEFVKHRMPPVKPSKHEDRSSYLVKLTSFVEISDPLSLAMVPLPGAEDGTAKLVHCVNNPRNTHMMGTAPADVCSGNDESEEEEDEEDEMENSDDEKEEEEQIISAHAAATLKYLCQKSPYAPVASTQVCNGTGEQVKDVLQQVGAPKSSWTEVCNLLTQLVSLGLARVMSNSSAGGTGRQHPPKKMTVRDNKLKKATSANLDVEEVSMEELMRLRDAQK